MDDEMFNEIQKYKLMRKISRVVILLLIIFFSYKFISYITNQYSPFVINTNDLIHNDFDPISIFVPISISIFTIIVGSGRSSRQER